ncbi:GDP-mannose-dependent alpha-(1-6)-phosphatidylinositol monomannoside mannosyltransferase [Corynebacterium capitovis DSM 44611]|uniref:glycosyltransferase family 4 protein n=1 Tax=Corynebacterium capitovis TaxID=131081 RepID=UPI000382DCAB|nr:glycosyltransferase family 4 protein [Corynebacterium capitovis]WKD57344.1 GDP-mannose-dependent alpha-(1-6)-phosphatidylinositol monomannoside mannosyltransferase [Corynebacterium capitovis DSM 44611]
MTTLLVTNDFPPTVGGIQSYLQDFAAEYVSRAGADQLVVFASTQDAEAAASWDATVPYRVVRWPRSVMLPTPATVREMQRRIREERITTVWFGAAAPLAVMGAAAKRAGATRVVATTHGHEVGWAMLPGGRSVLKRIGSSADVVTYISSYTLSRFRRAFGDDVEFEWLPSGVDSGFFRPATTAQRMATRERFGWGNEPLIVCASRLVPRKGQDQLIRALPAVREAVPGARLVLVGTGAAESRLRARVTRLPSSDREAVVFAGAVSRETLRDIVASANVFAMPARTRWGGLDVEGLGIVYLEAQACGVPVVAGASGGAPETVSRETGIVVDGRDVDSLSAELAGLLTDPERCAEMGAEGRHRAVDTFAWSRLGDHLYGILGGGR